MTKGKNLENRHFETETPKSEMAEGETQFLVGLFYFKIVVARDKSLECDWTGGFSGFCFSFRIPIFFLHY